MASSITFFPSSPLPSSTSIRNRTVSNPTLGANTFTNLPRRKSTGRIVTAEASSSNSAVTTSALDDAKEYLLPRWAEFDIGRAPVFWKTVNGLPPMSGEVLKIFYNPTANKLTPNEEFGIAFNGGFNQPIMCSGEQRSMTIRERGKADPPFFSIKIFIPQHAVNIIFSFTNGSDWDGPYKIQFQPIKKWKNKPLSFFNEGLAEELSKKGACDKAIFPDSYDVIARCSMIANLSTEGGDRCKLDLVEGCTDTNSIDFNPLANVDDGSCSVE